MRPTAPALGDFAIGLVRAPVKAPGKASSAAEALARHIADSLATVGRPMMAAA